MSSKSSNNSSQNQQNAALNPAAKAFVAGGSGGGGGGGGNNNNNRNNNNSGSSSAATAPLPAGEQQQGGGNPNNNNNGPRAYNGPTGGGGNNYQPPGARGGPGGVPPPLHPQNANPNLYNNNNSNNNNGTQGHGSSSFYPSHSAGGGGNVPNRNNWGNGPQHPHHHHHSHHNNNFNNNNNNNNFNNNNGPQGNNNFNNNNNGPNNNNFNNNNNGPMHPNHPMSHHHNNNNNNNGNNNNMYPHHHHHHHYHHHHHMHHQSHHSNISPNGPQGGNFPHPHHHHNNNFNNNNNNGPNNNNNFNNNNNNGMRQTMPPNRGRGGMANNNNGMNMGSNNGPRPGNMMNNNNMRNNEPRKAVVVLGAPKSGKTTLAKRIAQDIPGFTCFEAPLDKEKFDYLSEELKTLTANGGGPQMLVLDGFGADHDADLFYLSSVLKRNNYAVFGLVYLNLMEPSKTIRSRQEDVAPTTAQMFGHAVAYETCSQYDSDGHKNFILIQADQTRDQIFQDFKRMWEDASIKELDVVAPKVLKSIDRSLSWKMLHYGEFKNVSSALEKSLPENCHGTGTGTSPMPLRSAYGPLTYAHFSRWFSRLPKYQVSLMTNGQRIVLFAYNGSLYFLPEHGYYMFRYEPSDQPPAAARVTQWFNEINLKCSRPETACPLVLDAEYVIFQSEEYILLRDILVDGSEPCHQLPLRERVEKMGSCLYSRTADDPNPPNIQILPHRYANVEKVAEIFSVWDRAEEVDGSTGQPATKVGVGVRLEPPEEYVISQHDPNLLFWFDPTRIAIVARLWNLEEDKEGQRFQVLGVDDSTGIESRLPKDCPEKVFIPHEIVLDEQLGEGHIVELTITKRLANPPPASRGGRNQNRNQSEILEFKFERRRWDIAVPNYHSTISSIIHQAKHSWTKDYFKATCELVAQAPGNTGNGSGEGTPMTPSSPVAMN